METDNCEMVQNLSPDSPASIGKFPLFARSTGLVPGSVTY